jgi:hypothetical protein
VNKLIFCAVLVVAACHEKRPPVPTAEQSRQLDNAEDMLNEMARNEEGPEQRPSPSNSAN